MLIYSQFYSMEFRGLASTNFVATDFNPLEKEK